MTGTCLMPRAN